MFFLLTEEAGAAMATGSGSFLVMMLAMVAIFYFMIIRPENKKKKKNEQMLDALSLGDEITTIGGIMGKIVQITEDTITFETGEDRVRIQTKKWAIRSTAKMDAEEEAKTRKK